MTGQGNCDVLEAVIIVRRADSGFVQLKRDSAVYLEDFLALVLVAAALPFDHQRTQEIAYTSILSRAQPTLLPVTFDIYLSVRTRRAKGPP